LIIFPNFFFSFSFHLKGLEKCIGLTVVHWYMGDNGWEFVKEEGEVEGCSPEPFCGKRYLKELFLKTDPLYSGRFTVPVLFDKKNAIVINNESADILRMLNSEFNDFCETEDQKKVSTPPFILFYFILF